MSLTRARVLSARSDAISSSAEAAPTARAPRGSRHVLDATVVLAHAEAARILDDARRAAASLHEEARARAEETTRAAAQEAREAELARLAAVALYLDARERSYGDRELERAVDLARLLAERVVGAELALSPERVAHMAAALLGEARGAASARIFACREDLAALRATFASLELPEGTVSLEEDPSLLRGSLVVESDVGTVDGRLETRFELLAAALLEALNDRS